ncbi:hypothetical protein D3C80_1091380 [compost metagenome]
MQLIGQLADGCLALFIALEQGSLLLSAEGGIQMRLPLQFRPPFQHTVAALPGYCVQVSDARRKVLADQRHPEFERAGSILAGVGVAVYPLHVLS